MNRVTGVPPNSAGRIRPTANRDQGQQDQFTYDYDPAGNRLTSFEQGNNSTYSPNNLNQYSSVNGQNYTYDLNGNLTDDGTNQYEYDYENRLIRVTQSASEANYGYDPFGRRITSHTSTRPQETTLFIHDGDSVIEDYTCDPNFSACALVRSYLYSNRIDELLRSTTYDVQSTDYYYHHDALGNTIAITDKDQNLIETYQYDPYGNPHFFNANGEPITESQIGNRYLWTGREWNQESKTYHFRARTESPFLGRFMQRDPIGYFGGLNVYWYVANKPLKFKDPLGLFYFGERELDGFPDVSGDNDVFDKLNIKTRHEHGFFEDGQEPGDVGFRPLDPSQIQCGQGEVYSGEDPSRYTKTRENYDDATMRQAMENVTAGDYCLVGNNCQNYADRLRKEYRRLKNNQS